MFVGFRAMLQPAQSVWREFVCVSSSVCAHVSLELRTLAHTLHKTDSKASDGECARLECIEYIHADTHQTLFGEIKDASTSTTSSGKVHDTMDSSLCVSV